MRVNISYSVELEEVLENLKILYVREENNLHKKLKAAQQTLKGEYSDEKIGEIAAALKEYRTHLSSFDTKLIEILNIVDGYFKIRYAPDKPPANPEDASGEENA